MALALHYIDLERAKANMAAYADAIEKDVVITKSVFKGGIEYHLVPLDEHLMVEAYYRYNKKDRVTREIKDFFKKNGLTPISARPQGKNLIIEAKEGTITLAI